MKNGKPKKPKQNLFVPNQNIHLPNQPELSELDKALLEFDNYMGERLFRCANVMIQMLGQQHAQILAMKEALGVMPKPTAMQIAESTKMIEDIVMVQFGFGPQEEPQAPSNGPDLN